MKQIQFMLILLVLGVSANCQSPSQKDFKGMWVSYQYGDTIRIHFSDNYKIFVEIGHHTQMAGQYTYSVNTGNQDITLSIKPSDKTRMDFLKITLSKMNQEEFQIKEVIHFYNDMPPESELLEKNIYILKKQP
jgi:hypothetical protein